jgi:hypothetical protein
MITQTCNKCFRNLPLTEFSTRKDFIITLNDYRIHYNKICKQCVSARKAEWRASHPDYMTIYHRAMKQPAILKTCLNCGQSFESTNPMQVYCRPDCRHNTIAEEFKEWRKHYPHVSKDVFKRMILQNKKT